MRMRPFTSSPLLFDCAPSGILHWACDSVHCTTRFEGSSGPGPLSFALTFPLNPSARPSTSQKSEEGSRVVVTGVFSGIVDTHCITRQESKAWEAVDKSIPRSECGASVKNVCVFGPGLRQQPATEN